MRRKRKLNRKLFLWIVGTLITLGAGIHFLHGAQVRRSAEVLLDQANRAEQKGDMDRAQDYLERYLAVQPKDVAALLRLGDMLEKKGRDGTVQAIRVLEKALQNEPQDDVRLRVVRMWLGLPQPSFTAAKAHIDVLLRSPQMGQNAEVLELAGRTEEGLGRFAEAREYYEKALEQAPDRIEVYHRLAELLRQRLNDAAQADKVMDAQEVSRGGLIASNPTSAKAYLARASYRKQHEIPGAEDDITQALKYAPDDPEVLLAVGLLERAGGALDIARVHLDRARKLKPDRPEIYLALADLEMQAASTAPGEQSRAERMKDAVKWLEQGIERLPGVLTLKYQLAATLAQAKRLKEAQGVIDDLQKAGLRPELVQYLTAYVLMGQQKWREALQQLEPAQLFLASRHDMRELNKRVLLMMGECYARLGDLNNRYDAYRRAANIDLGTNPEHDPLWLTARFQLAESLRALGRIDQAIQEYTLILPKRPDLRLPVAQLMTVQNLKLPPEQQKRGWAFVESLLDRLDRDKPGMLEAAILRAEVLYAKDQAPQARVLLEKTRANYPNRIEPWLALVGLAERQNEDSLAVLEAAEEALGPRLELYLARAAYWARKKGPKAPEELIRLEGIADTALKDNDQNRLWREVAAAYAAIGMYDRSHRLWRRLAERLPNDLTAQMTSFELALQAKDLETAERDAKRLRALQGSDGTVGRYAEALLLAHQAMTLPQRDPKRVELLSRASNLLVRVAAARPTWSRAVVAQAEVATAQGLDDEAMRYYLHAIDDLGDRSPSAITAAAQLFYNNKRLSDADRMVRLLREQNVPISGELRRLVAEIAFQNRDYLRALEQAQQIITEDSDNVSDLIWLGRLRWAAGQLAEAERVLRRAVEKGPDKPEAHLALIAYLALSGRKEQAIQALDIAAKQLPPEAAPLALAEGNELLGRSDLARKYYDQALKAQPNDLTTLKAVASYCLRGRRLREATAHLRAIIEKHPNTAEARTARRTLVLVTAAGGNRQEAMKALESLGLSDTPGGVEAPAGSTLDDLRTKAQVLALQPNRLRRQEAINILNQILAADRPRADDMFLLAQLQEANGNWEESRQTMRKLMEAAPEPIYLAAFARSLLRHDNLAEAETYLARLERTAPTLAATIEIKARVLHARQKDDEATKLIRDFAAADPQRLRTAAQLLEELKQFGPAEELFREYVNHFEAREAGAVLALAGFLSRQGRTDEALNLIDEKVWNRLPAEVASNASVVLLYGARSNRAQYERVNARIQKALNEHPSAIPIQFDLANLRSLEGRYDEAAQIYRQIFEREPNRGVPLNNLAWMLALQGGKATEAMEAISKAIELEGETPELLDTRALVYLDMNQPDEAIQDLENALIVQPKNAEMHFHLAQAYQKRGRASDAANAFREAQRLGLTAEKLHPLERPQFNRMAAELAAKD
jgi:tetratricopeptide (TPR) repeat protein